jgi:hypothetical protein
MTRSITEEASKSNPLFFAGKGAPERSIRDFPTQDAKER